MQSALLWRQCGIWVLTRLTYLVVLAVAVDSKAVKAANNPWHLQPVVIVLCAIVGAADILRRGERLLIGNLGITRYRVAGILAAPPVLAEIVVVIVGSI